ncbi:aminopeptidase [Aliidiomarina sedimenti]|uniref:Aminopeptidase n=1 Tax=Aliidiomarina sedimenti TaxID=1933879 RepID=A0ABY0C2Y8_9GAMM|nr:PDZ domain-containing protein [Aliidiomarina sedimenti]RUO31810.1 aminopeptidase [Aliidiomarina sedimenti]
MSACPLHYHIKAADCSGHYFDVCLRIENPDPEGQTLRLPAWLPGSYMIRDFAKHVVEFSANHNNQILHYHRVDKQTWLLQASDGPIEVRYRVYANDLSVRTAFLDDTFGFYNHSALCLEVVGQSRQPCEVDIELPNGYDNWYLATGMPRLRGDAFGSGRFRADDYQQLIDFPVLMGELTLDDFIVHGTRHRIAIAGRHFADMDRISADLANICENQLDMFEGAAPFDDYTFLVMVTGQGFGGLEHRNSTALLCSRKDLIHSQQAGMTDSYRTFLSLCSHEYFHSWNIKRLRPREFIPFHLDKEQYTEQLWFYEGVTSYYDDYMVHRAGLSSPQQYLDTLATTLTRALMGQGSQRQTLTESSQLAWTTFYQQNENAPNAIVSYYSKGAIVALCADLLIRKQSNHSFTLDDVMRQLWLEYGKDERGTTMDSLIDCLIDAGGAEMRSLLQRALHTTHPLPLKELLSFVGVEAQTLALESDNGPFGKAPRVEFQVSLGARFTAREHGLELIQVYEGGSAYEAGLSAGDLLIAIDNLQINATNQLEFFSRYQAGDKVVVHAFRRDELKQRELQWQAPERINWVLTLADPTKASPWLSVPRG